VATARAETDPTTALTLNKARWLLKLLAVKIGARPIAQITAPELLSALRRVEEQDKLETARRMRSFAGRVFRYGLATGRCERNVAADLQGALTTPTVTHRAAILKPAAVGALLRAIEGYTGQPSTALALRLAPTSSCGLASSATLNGRRSILRRRSGPFLAQR
jgi:integrase